MPRRWLALLGVAGIAVGCGSRSSPASHRTATRSTIQATASAPPTDCNTLGINPTQMREGTCTHAGITYVIVDQNHTLSLHTLTAKLIGISAVSAIPGSHPATAQGRFVVASITIGNRLELPQTFDRSGTQQAGLILDGTVYMEDVGVESASDPKSCLSEKLSIPSGKSEACQVIFDVPASSAADLGKHGTGDLYLVDFGSDLSGSIAPQTIGQIRLYR